MNSNTYNKKHINFYGSMIPSSKRIIIGLTYIYGLGYSMSRDICYFLNIDSVNSFSFFSTSLKKSLACL